MFIIFFFPTIRFLLVIIIYHKLCYHLFFIHAQAQQQRQQLSSSQCVMHTTDKIPIFTHMYVYDPNMMIIHNALKLQTIVVLFFLLLFLFLLYLFVFCGCLFQQCSRICMCFFFFFCSFLFFFVRFVHRCICCFDVHRRVSYSNAEKKIRILKWLFHISLATCRTLLFVQYRNGIICFSLSYDWRLRRSQRNDNIAENG